MDMIKILGSSLLLPIITSVITTIVTMVVLDRSDNVISAKKNIKELKRLRFFNVFFNFVPSDKRVINRFRIGYKEIVRGEKHERKSFIKRVEEPQEGLRYVSVVCNSNSINRPKISKIKSEDNEVVSVPNVYVEQGSATLLYAENDFSFSEIILEENTDYIIYRIVGEEGELPIHSLKEK